MSKCGKICYFSNPFGECTKADYVNCPLEVPTPVVHGEWLNKRLNLHGYLVGTCSICRKEKMVDICCSNCGAKMDGDGNG